MEITNKDQARKWLLAWDNKPPRGIALEAVRGLRKCEAICRGDGRREMAANYASAALLIEPYSI